MDQTIVYILRGDDEYAMEREINALYASLGDPAWADMNTTRLDGRQAGLDEVQRALSTMPLFSPRRLVILSHPLTNLEKKDAQANFTAFLDSLPPTAMLVMPVEDRKKYSGGEMQWEKFHPSNWLVKWADKSKGRGEFRDFLLPTIQKMPDWIIQKTKELKGQIDQDAAQELALMVGNNPRVASLEIEKLLTYVNYQRPVEITDVDLLTASTAELDMFEMINTLASGQGKKAIAMLHRLLETEEASQIFYLVVRQFRLLIQAREIIDAGGGESQIMSQKIAPFSRAAKSLNQQARRFSMPQLITIYHRLQELDVAFKRSQMTPELALDMLIMELAPQ